MKQTITVSAPGKIILLGEHAVVYGSPALIAATDKRCFIKLTPRQDQKIKIISKNFGTEITTDLKNIIKKFDKAQKDWNKFHQNNDTQLLKSITRDPLDYPQIIIGQFIDYICHPDRGAKRRAEGSRYHPIDILNQFSSGFDLSLDSQIPVGSGMGSSAALAVSIIGALFLFTQQQFDKKTINEIALLAEQKKHGNPSGGDNSASSFGGLIWFKKNPTPDCHPDRGVKLRAEGSHVTSKISEIKPLNLKISPKITNNFYIVNTGTPDESTGEMVSLVKNLHKENPKFVDATFADQEKLTEEFLTALKNADANEIIRIIKSGEKNLESIGVVSPFTKTLITKIEQSGGAAKICGGGGITKATGIILIYHKNLHSLENMLKSHNLNAEQLTLGAEGLKQKI